MKLLFVLTFKGSLQKWSQEGVATREMEVPLEYLRRGIFSDIYIYTYSRDDFDILTNLPFEPELLSRIHLIGPSANPDSFMAHLKHSTNIKLLRSLVLKGVKISKTNQINGCWTALLAKLFGCRMYLRCGYILSRRLFKNRQIIPGVIALLLEIISFNLTDLASVTTEDAAHYIQRFKFFRRHSLFIAPTYVNTIMFNADIENKPEQTPVVFVGRLEPQKNVLSLIRACKLSKTALTVVGKGSLEPEVLKLAAQENISFKHFGSIQNEEIAELYRTHRYFVLPSLHEGLPKVLIEAMSAEMICIGTPTSGIRDLIKPGLTGYLTNDFSPEALAQAIHLATQDPLAPSFAKNARQWIVSHHSIQAYVDREGSYYTKILS